MSDDESTYHHGDLRSDLIKRALACLEEEGASKLSLRKIAAQAGVSHNAPYMHFASKQALLQAVANEGFALLGQTIADAGGREAFTDADWRTRMRAGLAAYVGFAQARPRLYALMHEPQGDVPASKSAAAHAGQETLDRLAQSLRTGQCLGCVRPGDPQAFALWVWVTLHGLAGLTGNPRHVFQGRSPNAVTDAVLTMMLDGLAADLA